MKRSSDTWIVLRAVLFFAITYVLLIGAILWLGVHFVIQGIAR